MQTIVPDRIDVAAGVLYDALGRVLVGQRIVQDLYYQKWEFPGGKLEPGETPEQALHRELNEELGVSISETQPLIELSHDYPDRRVRLFVLKVLSFVGEPYGREGQALRWVALDVLDQLDFLDANAPIMNILKESGSPE